MDLAHAPTGTTLFVAVYWVTYAASTAFVVAGLLLVPYYLVPLIRRWWVVRRLARSPGAHSKRSGSR
ncbi:MAG TPA: hypothetical protein VEK10_02285 [Steroidobacteraceae bacterium]|nr:hypothetical protein [Steroidobacteraceae bacterium]